MARPFFLSVVLGFMAAVSSGQVISGRILDRANKTPIAYANIGILNSSVGTISNDDGTFSLLLSGSRSKDTLLFSGLGYFPWKIAVGDIHHDSIITVLLLEKITMLDSVTISRKKGRRKTYWLGNQYAGEGNIHSDSISAGAAVALLIDNKYPSHHDLTFPVFVEKATLKISANSLDKFKVRIRLLDVDSDTHLPGGDLFDENFVVTSAIKSGWLTFDLSRFNLRVERPFFLVFEWILEEEDRLALLEQYKQFKTIHPEKVSVDTMVVRGVKIPYYNWYNFYAGTSFGVSPVGLSLDNHRTYYRNNSYGQWNLASTILTARILVSNQPLLPRQASK